HRTLGGDVYLGSGGSWISRRRTIQVFSVRSRKRHRFHHHRESVAAFVLSDEPHFDLRIYRTTARRLLVQDIGADFPYQPYDWIGVPTLSRGHRPAAFRL